MDRSVWGEVLVFALALERGSMWVSRLVSVLTSVWGAGWESRWASSWE